MPLKPREMIALLRKNGFRVARSDGSHMFFVNDETGKKTTVPYHSKELSRGLEQEILKQAGLKGGKEDDR